MKSDNKGRIVMLADCQSFYASVEKAAHPEYADQPVVLQEIRPVDPELSLPRVPLPSNMVLLPQNG